MHRIFLPEGLPGATTSGSGLSSATFGSGDLTITPAVQVGYQKIGLNFNLPLPYLYSGLDLSFKDANMWIGSLGVTADWASGFFLSLKAQGNAKRRITIDTPETVIYDKVQWDGTGLEWWTLEGSAGYRFSPGVSVLAGLRRDHLSVKMTNPRDEFGYPFNYDSSSLGIGISERYYGDFMSKLWIPYLGLQVSGTRYRASFLWSPFASGDVKIPTALLITQTVFPITVGIGDDMRHRARGGAQFLECNIEYDCNVSSNFGLQVWGSCNWMSLRRNGKLDDTASAFLSVAGVVLFYDTDSISTTDTATYRRYMLSGGLSAKFSF